eukprot:134053_1
MAYSIVFLLSLLLFLFYISNALPEEEIFYDYMDDKTASEWTYGGDVTIPSTASQCSPQTYCFELNPGGWAERSFSTQGYHSVYFRLTLDGGSSNTVDIKIYDDSLLVSDIGKSFSISESRKTIRPQQTHDWDNIDVFVIRFAMENSATVWMDRLELIGIPITNTPTVYSTTLPPVITPTSNPSTIPTIYPSIYPTSNAPTQTTNYPTQQPNKTPTNGPTDNPTQSPTDYEFCLDNDDDINAGFKTLNNEWSDAICEFSNRNHTHIRSVYHSYYLPIYISN